MESIGGFRLVIFGIIFQWHSLYSRLIIHLLCNVIKKYSLWLFIIFTLFLPGVITGYLSIGKVGSADVVVQLFEVAETTLWVKEVTGLGIWICLELFILIIRFLLWLRLRLGGLQSESSCCIFPLGNFYPLF